MARIEIDEALSGPPDAAAVATTSQRGERFLWASTVALIAALAGAAIVWALRPAPSPGEMRFEITTPPTTDVSVAISPDGKRIAFVATTEGVPRLWVRSLDSDRAAPLGGTDGARAPFWAPDSRTVAFFTTTDNQLKRIDIENGSLSVVATVTLGTGGTWNRDDTILFAHLAASAGISRVSANGGQASEVTRLGKDEPSHQFPQFLPDGRHFLYYTLDAKPPVVQVGSAQWLGDEALARCGCTCRFRPLRLSPLPAPWDAVCAGFRSGSPGADRQSFSSGGARGFGIRGAVCIRHRDADVSNRFGG